MSIIPRTKENQRMNANSPVPIGSTEWTQEPYKATMQVGDQLMKIGADLAAADTRLKAEEGTNEIQRVYKEGAAYAEQNSAPDGSDLQAKFTEYTSGKVGDIRNSYGSNPFAGSRIDAYADKAALDMESNIKIAQAQKLEVYNKDRIDQLQTTSTQRIYANPNPELLKSEIVSNNQLIDDLQKTGGISSGAAAKLKEKFYDQTAESMIKGMILRQQYGRASNMLGASQEDANAVTALAPDEAQKMGLITNQEATALKNQNKNFEVPVMTKGDKVKLSPEQAMIMNRLSPNLRESLSQQLQSKLKEHTVMRLSDLNAQLEGFDRISLSGQPMDPRQVSKMRNEVNSNPNLTPDARIRLMDRINTNVAMNQTMVLAQTTPKGQMPALLENLKQNMQKISAESTKLDPRMAAADTDFATVGNRQRAVEEAAKNLSSLYDARDKDPVANYLQTDHNIELLHRASRDAGQTPAGTEALKKYNDALIAKSKYLGAPIKILAKQETQTLVDTLKTMPNSQEADRLVEGIRQKYGEHFPRVMNEMVALDKDMAPYAATVYADPYTRRQLMDGIKNKPAIDKEFNSGGLYADQKSTVEMSVKNQMLPFRKVLVTGNYDTGNLATLQGIEEAVNISAKRAMVNSNVSPSEAAERAYKDVIADQYHIVESGRNSIMVPRRVGDPNQPYLIKDTKLFEGFMNAYSKPDNFKDLDIAVPNSEKNPKEFYQKLGPSVRWVTNPSQTGLQMKQQLPDGSMRSIYDRTGKQVEKSYEDIYIRPDDKTRYGVESATRQKYIEDSRIIRSKL